MTRTKWLKGTARLNCTLSREIVVKAFAAIRPKLLSSYPRCDEQFGAAQMLDERPTVVPAVEISAVEISQAARGGVRSGRAEVPDVGAV